jgi:hypothetical protein
MEPFSTHLLDLPCFAVTSQVNPDPPAIHVDVDNLMGIHQHPTMT